MRKVLFVISGPSGVGKGTLVKRVLAQEESVVKSVSCTTRAPRDYETHGVEYFFLSEREFRELIDKGEFFEYDYHFSGLYGTPKKFVERQLREKSVILEIDVKGALNAKAQVPSAVLIFIEAPSLKELESRLDGRGSETEEKQKERLERVRFEMSQEKEFDYVIVNDDLDVATQKLLDIIRAEQNKAE